MIRSLVTKLAVMIGFPWLAVTLAPSDAGMAICFVLFFAANPIFALADGWFAGKDVRRRWWYPAATAICFLLGVWCFFAPGEPAFFLYALYYLVIGVVSMVFSALIQKTHGSTA